MSTATYRAILRELYKGVSETCPTFGNEPLSDDGKKFDVLGVELWYVGS